MLTIRSLFGIHTTTMPVSTRSKRQKNSLLDHDESIEKPKKTRRDTPKRKQDSTTPASHPDDVIVCGTSGYSYAHWKHSYYPTSCNTAVKQFEQYSTEFRAVELNATFYKWHKRTTWEAWRDRAEQASNHNNNTQPFIFAIKAHQYFTHWRRLTIDDVFIEKFRDFVSDCRFLGRHCGPILMQFPPRFVCNETTLGRLKDFGKLVQDINNSHSTCDHSENVPRLAVALEFRHDSWFRPLQWKQVCNVTRQYTDLCTCLVHLVNQNHWANDMSSGFSPTLQQYSHTCCCWGMYARFHGTTGQYEGSYTDEPSEYRRDFG